MEINKQIVYLPVEKSNNLVVNGIVLGEYSHITDVKLTEGYFFTPEQLNEYIQEIIKQTLETAAEKARMYETVEGGSYRSFSTNETDFLIDEYSITNTFEETYNKFKV